MPQMVRTAFLVGFLLAATLVPAAAAPYRVDPASTQIAFEIGAKGYPMTRGVFRRFTSQLSIDLDNPQRSSVRLDVDAASLDTGTPGLDAYVRGPAFLDAERYPAIRFTSKAVEKLDDRTVRVSGDLTLLGVTRPESVAVEVDRGDAQSFSFHVAFDVRRSQFGMTTGLPLISDDVRIIVVARARGR